MYSIGNDIVDLNFIDKERSQTRPFYSKILSETEQRIYPSHFSSVPFWQYVWLLWSCKEAVFKFARRLQPDLVFSPVKTGIQPSSPGPIQGATGITEPNNLQDHPLLLKFFSPLYLIVPTAAGAGLEVVCNTVITKDYIHSITYLETYIGNIVSDIKRIDETDPVSQSAAVRELISEKLTAQLPGADITFNKADAGYPIILNNGIDTRMVASFAHHGNYVAFAYQ